MGAVARVSLAVVLAAAGAPAAHGATVVGKFQRTVHFTAAEGELNDLEITVESSSEGSKVVFRDRVPLEAERNCELRAAGEVACVGRDVYVDLGDGDDSARAAVGFVAGGPGQDTLSGADAWLLGGAGDDHLSGRTAAGGAGDDVLVGTDVAAEGYAEQGYTYDQLVGGADADELRGGAGPDLLQGDREGEPTVPAELALAAFGDGGDVHAPDLIDGGAGTDVVSYALREAAVSVDLRTGLGGTGAEGDAIAAVENVQGGAGADELLGDDLRNELRGGGGDDLVDGRGGDDVLKGEDPYRPDDVEDRNRVYGGDGDDVLAGNEGRNVLDGGPGDDELGWGRGNTYFGGDGDDVLAPASSRQPVECGAGADTVMSSGRALLQPDCEEVRNGWIGAPPYPVARARGALAFRFECPYEPCQGTFSLSLPRAERPFATVRYRALNGRPRVRVKVPRAIQALPQDPLRIRVMIVNRPRYLSGYADGQWVFDLRQTGLDAAP